MAITYLPTSRTIAIDMSKLAGITTAGSFDPMNGSYVAAAGSPFVNAGDRQFTPLVSRQQQRGRWRLGAAARGRGSAKVIISIRRIFPVRGVGLTFELEPSRNSPGQKCI